MADENKTPIEEVKATDEVKPAWYFVKDARGYGSVTVTLVFVAFWVVTFAYITSLFTKIGPVTFKPFDVAACASYMGPILALYGARKFTDAKFGKDDNK